MRSLLVALTGVACGVAAPASAEPIEHGNAALNWSRLPGAEACPDVGELARRVAVQLKRDAFVSPTAATVFVDVTIRPAQPGFRIRILLSSHDQAPPGERELTSSSLDCNDAVDSAALAIALMLDPEALTRSDEPGPPPAAAAPTPSPPVPIPSPPPSIQTPAKLPPATTTALAPPVRGHARFALGAQGAIDQVPGFGLGVSGGLRLGNRGRTQAIEVGIAYLAPRQVQVRAGAGGQFSLVDLGVSHVWSPLHRGSWVLSVLTSAQAARIFASGFGFTASNRDVGSWMVSGTLEGEADLAVSERWDLMLRIGLGVPLWRDSFEATTAGGTVTILNRTPLFGSLGFGLAFSP
jgi:hypothetical protein